MRVLINGGIVVDATGREPWQGGAVAIEGGRILEVGPASRFPDPAWFDQVVDASGCTVLPGIVDSHVHVLGYPRRSGFSEAEAGIWGANYLRAALQGGATTIRDMGAKYEAIFALKRRIESGWLVAPRLLAAGAALCRTGGHGFDALGSEADGPDGIRRLARQQLKIGADVVKVMATGGVGTPGQSPLYSQLTVEEMRAAVEEAHKAGKRAAAHAIGNAGIKDALRAGLDCIEHGMQLDDAAIDLMLKNGTILCPTLSAYRRIVEGAKVGLTPAHALKATLPLVDAHFEGFKKALAAGVRVIFGTDSGSPFHPLGDLASELEIWAEAGMKPLVALETATRVTAEVCGIEEEVGTLEPGRRADVLIVEGDATADLGAMNRVRRVMRDGVTVHEAEAYEAAGGLIARPVMGPRPGARPV